MFKNDLSIWCIQLINLLSIRITQFAKSDCPLDSKSDYIPVELKQFFYHNSNCHGCCISSDNTHVLFNFLLSFLEISGTLFWLNINLHLAQLQLARFYLLPVFGLVFRSC